MKRVFVCFCFGCLASAPTAASDLEAGSCGPVKLMESGHAYPLKSSPPPARVRSKPVQAPRLHLRFQDRLEGTPPGDLEILVCYDWRWFQYPYPETLFGSWEISYECRRCRLDSEGAVTVAAHEVTPRGWYEGWLRFGRQPRFEGVRLTVDRRGSSQSFPYLTGKTLQRLREDGADPVRLETADLEVTASPAVATSVPQSP